MKIKEILPSKINMAKIPMSFLCKIFKNCFSETRGIAFFGLDILRKKLKNLVPDSRKRTYSSVSKAAGHSKDIICRWVEIAGTRSKKVTA
jgi:hypothetical protein